VNLGIKVRIPKQHYGIVVSFKLPKGVKVLPVKVNTSSQLTLVPIKIHNTSKYDMYLDFNEIGFTLYVFTMSMDWHLVIREDKMIKRYLNPDAVRKNTKPIQFNLLPENMDLSKTQLNLVEMAQQSDLSATSYNVQMEEQPLQCLVVNMPDIREGLDKKLYFTLFMNNFRMIGCIDSGSDLTILQERHFNIIFDGKTVMQKCPIKYITSYSNHKIYHTFLQVPRGSESICLNLAHFGEKSLDFFTSCSNHKIPVIGQVNCNVQFTNRGLSANITVIVVKNLSMTIPTLLFGNDSFKSCLATLSYTGVKSKPTPEFLVHIPRRVIVPVYQASPSEIFTCKAEYTLEPYETKNVDFYLHCAAPVIRTEEILIT
jgi:hypothetical protein